MENTGKNETVKAWYGLLDDPSRAAAHRSYVDEWEKTINAFVQIDPQDKKGEGALAGIPFGVKDNIAVEGLKLSCASKILEGFTSPYTATAVERLEKIGARVYGKCNLDEFGMGSSCENSVHGASSNPWDPSRVPGGSSGGSAAAVAAGLVPFALGSDTGGSVRQPASFCGVYGLKPTYGSVSRYGLVAYASSLESVGILSKDIDTCRLVFDTIKGEDPRDQTSVPYEDRSGESSKRRIAVLEDLSDLSPGVDDVYRKTLEGFEKLGWEIIRVRLKTLDYVVPAYYTIATAEASANLARYTGIRYGYRAEGDDHADMVRNTRTEGFGHEVKLRILLGTYVLRSGFQDQYYGRAQRIRTLIGDEFSRVFEGAEMLLMPAFPVSAFPHGESGMDAFQQKLADKFTAAANLAGIPGLSFPAGMDGNIPVGMQLLAPPLCEERLFNAAREFCSVYEPARCPGFKEPS